LDRELRRDLQAKGEMAMTDFERFEQIIDEWFSEDDLD
jgi:hypothetical protein